jgi:hypothetical protein
VGRGLPKLGEAQLLPSPRTTTRRAANRPPLGARVT